MSSGTSQAIRASASISGPPSLPRIVAMAPSITYSETRSSSRWDARSRSPTAGPAGCSGSPAAIRSDCSEAMRADLCRRQADLDRRAQLGDRRHQRVAVGRVGREQDLAGRHEREQRLHVGRHPPGGVEQQVGMIGRDAPDPGQVDDAGVGEDEAGVRVGAGQLHDVRARAPGSRGRRGSGSAAALVGDGGELPHRGMVKRELLGARVQLDPLARRRPVPARPRHERRRRWGSPGRTGSAARRTPRAAAITMSLAGG